MEFQMRVRSRVRNCPNEFSSGHVRARMIGPRGPPESWTSSSNREAEDRGKKREREKKRREDPPNKTAKKL